MSAVLRITIALVLSTSIACTVDVSLDPDTPDGSAAALDAALPADDGGFVSEDGGFVSEDGGFVSEDGGLPADSGAIADSATSSDAFQ